MRIHLAFISCRFTVSSIVANVVSASLSNRKPPYCEFHPLTYTTSHARSEILPTRAFSSSRSGVITTPLISAVFVKTTRPSRANVASGQFIIFNVCGTKPGNRLVQRGGNISGGNTHQHFPVKRFARLTSRACTNSAIRRSGLRLAVLFAMRRWISIRPKQG